MATITHHPEPHAPSIPVNLPGGPPAPADDDPALLERMRAGDREAAARFLCRHGDLVRRRVRGKLGAGMRRLFDSQDILSTVGRRLDAYVRSGRLRAATQPELWALVFRITEVAVVHKVRAYSSLRRAEGEDGPVAAMLLSRLERAEREQDGGADGAELELDRTFAALKTDADRELLALWLSDVPLFRIAQAVGSTPAAVRQRWRAIREHLAGLLNAGAL